MNTRRAGYRAIAPCYDLVSLEWPVYRAGRRSAIELLDLRPGERVLDLGCGTGLDVPGVRARVGAGGGFLGVDSSPQMLAVAARRAPGWAEFRTADMTVVDLGEQQFDAVLACYALSLVPGWSTALDRAVAACRPGARLAVVDMQPAAGPGRLLSRAAMWAGGADPAAHPWTAVEQRCTAVRSVEHWAGHVQVRVGTLSPPA